MAITHSKVSGVADGGDASLVRPSDWNANHVGTWPAENLDQSGTTTENAPSAFDDIIVFYDLSAAAFRKTTLGNLFSPARQWGVEDEFLAVGDGLSGTISTASGTGAQVTLGTGERSHPGVATLETGTTTTGRAGFLSTAAAQIRFGGGRTRFSAIIRATSLSDGTETYTLRAGFGDTASAEFTDGAFFRYTHSVNSGEFQGVCRSNSVETTLDTNVALAAATWYRLEIEVNAAGTSVEFFIGAAGVAPTSVGTITTNIPTAAGRETGVCPVNIIKSAGTTNRLFDIDYYSVGGELTTAR